MEEVDVKNYSIGALVGRFQVDELHEGHHHVIKQVTENHRKTILFLGTPKFVGTRNNPLDFDSRKRMVHQDYPDTIILSIPDQSSNERWTHELDKRVREVFQHGEVLLYGGRDSFIPHYKNGGGEFQTKELEPLGTFTGTDIRKLISEEVKNSQDFRSGIIYQAHNIYPKVRTTVDVAILDDDGKVLLQKKHDESLFRFIGGFVRTTDSNMLSTAKRVVRSEVGNGEYASYKSLTTMRIEDWRFRDDEDTIMTTLFKCKKMWGAITPGRGISELKWFNIEEIQLKDIMKEHHVLVEYLQNK